MMYSQYSGGANINIEIVNSIFSGGYGAIYFGENVDLKIDNSLIFRPLSQEQIYANGISYKKEDFYLLGTGLISENPYFILPAWGEEGDYHLLNNSPCIDSGEEFLAPLYDLENISRPMGDGFDMGAYEK